MLEDWKGAHRFLCTERILTHQRTFPGGSELITLLSLCSTPLVCLSPENSRLTIIAHWTLTKTSSTAFNSHALWKNRVVTFLYLSLLRKNSHHTSPFFQSLSLCLDSTCSCSAIPHLSTRCPQCAALPPHLWLITNQPWPAAWFPRRPSALAAFH